VSDQNTVGTLATEIGSAFLEAGAVFRNDDVFAAFMYGLGWDFAGVPAALNSVAAPANQIATLLQNGELSGDQIAELVAAIASFIGAVNAIPSQPAGSFPAGLDVAAFKSEFPQQFVDALIVDYLFMRRVEWATLLKLAGVVRLQDVPATPGRPAFTRRSIAWQDLGRFFSEPGAVFQNAYHWGQANFLDASLLQNVSDVLDAWNVTSQFAVLDPAIFAALTAGALNPDNLLPTLQVPFFEELYSGVGGAVGLELQMLPQTASTFGGAAILPYVEGTIDDDISLSDSVSLQARGQLDVAGGIAVVFRPNAVTFVTGAPGAAGTFSLALVMKDPTGAKTIVLGTTGASRLEYSSLSLAFGSRVDAQGASFFAETALKDGALVIAPGQDADGFLAKLLPDKLSADASVTIGVDSRLGVYFSGSAGLEIQIPAHISLGPIEIMSVTIAVKPTSGALPIELGATLQGNLGPLQAVVENVGVRIPLTFPAHGGNLGPVNAGLQFKPPTGVGLSLNAGVVTGGGFLSFDPDRGEYAGALQLGIADFLTVSAIGLISTRMPDGSRGFSLLIIITADFGAGIQLSFGFTLLAVGGLLGLNRTVLFQPLMDGVKSGAIQSVMFPQNVIANAPRIISDLRALFPPQDGTFLIGPMAKIGWGTPTLISLSLGVIIEIPPGNAAILGVMKIALPADELPILVLQVNFAGALEFDKQRFYFFASLFDSHVLFITLTGDMGVLFAYGDNANFVLSVGGFHPQFNPPPLPFPAPQRIAIDLINESFAKIHSDGYFAVTTNTVQFGAHSSFFFGFSACSVEGSSGFDALIQFSPFHFIAEISTQFSVKVFGLGVYGVGIDVSLEGPTPWHVHGTASLSFFFFSIDIGIDFTWGDNPNTTLPPVAVMPLLEAEFKKNTNWRAQLPPTSRLLVTLRQLDPSETAMVLHPAGTLQVSQRTIPLDLHLDKVGSQKPSDADQFSLNVGGTTLVKTRTLTEPFAPSQFRNFDDAAKLSQPAFVPQDSGIELAGGNALASATATTRPVRYNLTVIDKESEPVRSRFFPHTRAMFGAFLRANSAAQSPLSAAHRAKTKPYADAVAVANETFAVALQSSNKAVHAGAMSFTSQTSAQDYLNKLVTDDPSLSGTLHVLPKFEVAA
jgi:hypothetical protein